MPAALPAPKIQHVVNRRKGELCVCDLAARLGVGSTAVSNHLRSMRLVRYRREGKMAYYALADGHITRLPDECRDHVQET